MKTQDQVINEIAASLAKAFGSAGDSGSKMSKAEQVELLKAVASSDENRRAYIKSRAEVLLPQIDVQSTVRKIFTPENLAPGAQSAYPISFDYTEVAAYMPKFGGNVVSVVEGDELFVPTFGIEGGIRYSIDIARDGRLDIANQSMNQLKNRILAKEEDAGWRTIRGALSGFYGKQTVYCSGNTVDGVGTPENFHNFTKKAIVAMKVKMDEQRRELTDVFVSPRSLGDVLEWSQNSVDFMTAREIYQNGGFPAQQIWGIKIHKVYDTNLVSDANAYGFDTRTFGKMPIRQALTTYEDPTAILDWQVGILGREIVGFGVTDSWAIVKAVLDSSRTGTSCSTF
jgi:hypothetical protein